MIQQGITTSVKSRVSWAVLLHKDKAQRKRGGGKNDKREHKKRRIRAKLSITCFAATLESVHQLTSSSQHSHSKHTTPIPFSTMPELYTSTNCTAGDTDLAGYLCWKRVRINSDLLHICPPTLQLHHEVSLSTLRKSTNRSIKSLSESKPLWSKDKFFFFLKTL